MQKFIESILARTLDGGSLLPLASATVTVYNTGTLVKPTIYSDNGTTVLANPFLSDAAGRVAFYAADGRYDIVASKLGYDEVTFPDVLLEDPEDGFSDDGIWSVGSDFLDDGSWSA